jgi:hypothetical protein
MTMRLGKYCVGLLVASGLATVAPGHARAQENAPGLRTVETNVTEATAPAAGAAPAASASANVFDAYRVFVDSAAAQRTASGLSSLIVGGGVVGIGFLGREQWSSEFGTVLVVTGALAAAGGVLTLVIPTEAENIADTNGVYLAAEPSPEQEVALERDWERLANKTRTARHVGAAIGFVLSGAAMIAGGVVLATGAVDDDTERWLVPTLFLSGVATAGGSAAALLIETPTETSYQAYLAARGRWKRSASSGTPPLRLSAAPLPSGGWVSLSTSF